MGFGLVRARENITRSGGEEPWVKSALNDLPAGATLKGNARGVLLVSTCQTAFTTRGGSNQILLSVSP